MFRLWRRGVRSPFALQDLWRRPRIHGRRRPRRYVQLVVEQLEDRIPLAVFANSAAITISAAGTSGVANPYPSNIVVSSLFASIQDITVTLNGFTHTFPDDVDVLLLGPSGATLVLMSDVGSSIDASNLNFTFDDAAANSLSDSTALASGTFRPTNIGAGDTFAAPAPAGPHGTPPGSTLASVFDGTNPNGTWSLYVTDDAGGDAGNFSGGWSLNISAVPPSPPTTAGQLIISEFRVRGPSGANDEFIELYNTTGSALTVQSADPSAGLAVAASNGVARCVVPNGTVIPAAGHYLCVNSVAYSLASYPAGAGTTATGDATYTTDIPDNAGIALFNNSTGGGSFSLANRLDAVGSTSEANTVYKEGTGYPALTPFSIDYSFYRDTCGKSGSISSFAPCTIPTPKDTNNNAVDFIFVDTNGTSAGAGQRLGAPGPENSSGPTAVVGGGIAVSKLDTCTSGTAAPNRIRDFTSDPPNNSTFGTFDFRRTITNNTGSPLTRLRFRVVDITTFPAPSGIADLRPRTSTDVVVTVDRPGCGAGTSNVTVHGTTLEQPPSQPNGSGFNGSLSVNSITSETPLAPGASVDVRFLVGLQQTGNHRFCVEAEAVPAGNAKIYCDAMDYGDAPDSYSTLYTSDGARHGTGETESSLKLGSPGSYLDTELDGQPNANANGDDTDLSGDDDNGLQIGLLERGASTSITVIASDDGQLDAFIDFDGDGNFSDVGEKIFDNVNVVDGVNILNLEIPDTATVGPTFARFRISTAGGLSFNGSAADGEVEDYRIAISRPRDKLGVHRTNQFFEDVNDNGTWNTSTGGDRLIAFGNSGDVPLAGDWDGDGFDEVGIKRGNQFYLDANGNGTWNGPGGGDIFYTFGNATDVPLVGDWDGDGDDQIGIHRGNEFYLDANGNGIWNNVGGGDVYLIFGNPGDTALAGDWDGDGDDQIGIHRGTHFYLDFNGNGVWNTVAGGDRLYNFGAVNDTPLSGDWNADGADEIGVHRSNVFYLDKNGNGVWNGNAGGDRQQAFGNPGDNPLPGKWQLPDFLLAEEGVATSPSDAPLLTHAALAPILQQAIIIWANTGLNSAQLRTLQSISVAIADLPGAQLGMSVGGTILLDADAVGYGWFVDPTPVDSSEFDPASLPTSAFDVPHSMDLLSAVLHELGHELGFDHDDDVAAMMETLSVGTRRLP